MERHRCKVCFRSFGDGRALGGHMIRSHTMNSSKHVEALIHSCSSSQGEVVEDREDGETASLKIRAREAPSESGESPVSSVSDTSTDEDVARCLMMLSRDRWERGNKKDDDESGDSGHLRRAKRGKVVIKRKYKCETCNKLFKSYQALGGHRASYNKKIKIDVAARFSSGPAAATTAAATATEEKVHECPFCDRVFASGQALGGHKRSHFRGALNVRIVSRISENLDIDLNLPAPVDDGEQ